jgi:hypothetical protein
MKIGGRAGCQSSKKLADSKTEASAFAEATADEAADETTAPHPVAIKRACYIRFPNDFQSRHSNR